MRSLVDGFLDGKSQEHLLLLRHPRNAAQVAAFPRSENSSTKVHAPLHRWQLDVDAWFSNSSSTTAQDRDGFTTQIHDEIETRTMAYTEQSPQQGTGERGTGRTYVEAGLILPHFDFLFTGDIRAEFGNVSPTQA